nr:MAG TPA: hypothetical protein [Caudoviricetes sp.]
MERGQFTFYRSFASALRRIRKDADRARAYDAICDYALDGKEPDLSGLSDAAAIAFELIKPTLDASKRKAENGKRGANANQEQSASKPIANSKQADSKQKAKGKRGKASSEKEKEKENIYSLTRETRSMRGGQGIRKRSGRKLRERRLPK